MEECDADGEIPRRVQVRFIADGPTRTRVELEHRNLDHHRDGWEGMRKGVGGDQGWRLYLDRLSAAVSDGT